MADSARIETITVDAPYCFGDAPLELGPLAAVNFVFAPNGSGKTTISERLRKQPADPSERERWHVAPTPLPIRVFNEKYKQSVLTEQMPGVFTVGEDSESLFQEIAELDGKERCLTQQIQDRKDEIGDPGNGQDSKTLYGKLAESREDAKESVFEVFKHLPKLVQELVFDGYRNSKEKFLDKAVAVSASGGNRPEELTWEQIERQARQLQEAEAPLAELPSIATKRLCTQEELEFLERKGLVAGGGRLAALINTLGHQDWVNQGREHLPDAKGLCPFCQQPVPGDLESQLDQFFADSFDRDLDRARQLHQRIDGVHQHLLQQLDALTQAVQVDTGVEETEINTAITAVRAESDSLVRAVVAKVEHPTESNAANDPESSLTRLSALIDAENTRIKAHNQIVADKKTAKKQLQDDGWKLFAAQSNVLSELKKYMGIRKKYENSINELEEANRGDDKERAEVSDRLRKLRLASSSTAKVAHNINHLLQFVGFHRFAVVVDEENAGAYRICRQDNSPAHETLSEGERTFISFAYFWQSLNGSTSQEGNPERVIVVIDDPISSLDRDILFMVAAEVRSASQRVWDGKPHIEQLLVLTHNAQFHREASYSQRQKSRNDVGFFRLVKGEDGFSRLWKDGNVSRVRGSYEMLWLAVVEAARSAPDGVTCSVGLHNVVRRIIEHYFAKYGNGAVEADGEHGLQVQERIALEAFWVWANANSHRIDDDSDYSDDFGSAQAFLHLFHHFFKSRGHGAHFDMMIERVGGGDLLEPGGLFASVSLSDQDSGSRRVE